MWHYVAFMKWYEKVCKDIFALCFSLTTLTFTQTNHNYSKAVTSININLLMFFFIFYFMNLLLQANNEVCWSESIPNTSINREETARANILINIIDVDLCKQFKLHKRKILNKKTYHHTEQQLTSIATQSKLCYCVSFAVSQSESSKV